MVRESLISVCAFLIVASSSTDCTQMSLLETVTASYPEYWANFGYAVAAAGDLNGDGVDEFLVSAPNEDAPYPVNSGTVYVFDGATRTRITRLKSSPLVEGAKLGQSLAGIGDTDGRDTPDILAGAPYEDVGEMSSAGAAYVFSGSELIQLLRLQPNNPCANCNFGSSVTGIDDITGDGLADAVVGANREEPFGEPPRSGRVRVFNGNTGQQIRLLISPNETENGMFGMAVVGISDLNSDSSPELVVGAPGDTIPGTEKLGLVYIFSSADWSVLRILESPAPDTYGKFGSSLAVMTDISGDGIAELIIGASGEDIDGITDLGRVYVFSGATGILLHTLHSPYPEDVPYDEGEFGTAVADAGDIDADGINDILVGALHEDPEGSPQSAGRAYVFSGDDGSLIYALVSPDDVYEGYFGCSVASIGSVFGDERAELVIGAYHEDPWPAPSDVNGGKTHVMTPPIVLTGMIQDSDLVLQWTADPRAAEYAIHGMEVPFFLPLPNLQHVFIFE